MLYERPREKVRYRGVRFLTTTELLQVIIGSGTARVSGAKLARKVEEYIATEEVGYETLVTIDGIGHAKACQILASLELGRRLEGARADRGGVSAGAVVGIPREVFNGYLHQAVVSGAGVLTCYWFDGSGTVIDSKRYAVHKNEHGTVLVKRVFVDILAVSAQSLLVFYPSTDKNGVPTAQEMAFVRHLYDAARYFQVHLREVYGVYRKGYVGWKKEVI